VRAKLRKGGRTRKWVVCRYGVGAEVGLEVGARVLEGVLELVFAPV
jgi:hypothetical protein